MQRTGNCLLPCVGPLFLAGDPLLSLAALLSDSVAAASCGELLVPAAEGVACLCWPDVRGRHVDDGARILSAEARPSRWLPTNRGPLKLALGGYGPPLGAKKDSLLRTAEALASYW